jgi:hypothetical protein
MKTNTTAATEIPAGFHEVRVFSLVRQVYYARHSGGLMFSVSHSKHYDSYLKDEIGSIGKGLEESIDFLRAEGFSEDEIKVIFDDARDCQDSPWEKTPLPRPVKVVFTVLRRN